jgi:thiamine pyrophosphate-dependent acetolactate synthase large subunit-like protein
MCAAALSAVELTGEGLCWPQVIHVNYFSAVIDPVYFPHLEVIGDIGNAIWQLCERVKDSPPTWDTRWSTLCLAFYTLQAAAEHGNDVTLIWQ